MDKAEPLGIHLAPEIVRENSSQDRDVLQPHLLDEGVDGLFGGVGMFAAAVRGVFVGDLHDTAERVAKIDLLGRCSGCDDTATPAPPDPDFEQTACEMSYLCCQLPKLVASVLVDKRVVGDRLINFAEAMIAQPRSKGGIGQYCLIGIAANALSVASGDTGATHEQAEMVGQVLDSP